MPRVLIFGTGSVGSVYAAILQRGGAEVTTICRSNHDAVKEHGIKVESKLWGDDLHCTPAIVARTVKEAVDVSHDAKYDFVVVASKVFPGNVGKIASAITANHTAIVLAQNGIRIEDEYAREYPGNTVISGVVYLPATQTAPGVVRVTDIELLEIGTYPALHRQDDESKPYQQLKEFQHMFSQGGGTCKVYRDVQEKRWTKLAINAAWNPICALTRSSDASFLQSTQTASDHSDATYKPGPAEATIRGVFEEIAKVASAAGYSVITPEVIDYHLGRARLRIKTGGNEPSMLADARHGRQVEVEAILGNTIRVAEEHGLNEVDVPRLNFLYILLRGLNYGVRVASKP